MHLDVLIDFLISHSSTHFPYTRNDKTQGLRKTHTGCSALWLKPRYCASLMPVSESPRIIQGMSVRHCRWACQWPIGLAQRATVRGYQCQHSICVTACVYIRRHQGWPTPPRTDVQTDVHIVPVDSDSALSNLLILPTSSVALVHHLGAIYLSGAPSAVTSHVQHIDL